MYILVRTVKINKCIYRFILYKTKNVQPKKGWSPQKEGRKRGVVLYMDDVKLVIKNIFCKKIFLD